MKLNRMLWPVCTALLVWVAGVSTVEAQLPPVPPGTTAVAQGLFGPRGLKFGPDGGLYVALSGPGGTNSTADVCPQLQVPMAVGGPYTNGNTASIVKVDKKGNVTTVASGFPSALSQRPDVNGVADIAFLDGELYAVTAGGGCSHGSSIPNMVAKVNERTGTWTMLANMSEAVAAHPAANVAPDFEADGIFYSMIAANGKLYTVEANHGQIWSVTKKGDVDMVTDVSKVEGHIVPTSAVERGGGLVVSNLGLFPITPDSEKLLTLEPDCGLLQQWLERCDPGTLQITGSKTPGLTTVVSLAWGPDGLLYALELSDAGGLPTPGAGKVVRVNPNGLAEDVFTGLDVPTGMTFGPDGALYVSNWGAADAPIGQILRISVASGGRPWVLKIPEQ
jgi:hypothetical protein